MTPYDKTEYPFNDNFLSIRGNQYHYLDEGKGETVVMLHGNPTWSFYYRNVVKELRPKYRTIVPDHMGCGLSDKPSDQNYSYTLENRVSDLATLLDHLEIEDNITLLLHDWGGMIGMAYADRFPDKIKRIIVTNTSAFHLPETKKLPTTIKLCQKGALGSFLVRGLNAFSRGANQLCVTKKQLKKPIKEAYLAPYDSWASRRAVHRFVQDIPLSPDHPTFSVVSSVENGLDRFKNIPMLICWGAKDFVFDDHFLAKWEAAFPNADVHKFPESGHYLLEDSWNEVKPLINNFLQSNPI